MSEHKFFCPACGQKIACDSSAVGSTITCPSCQVVFSVPMLGNSAATTAPTPPPAARSQTVPPASPRVPAQRPPPMASEMKPAKYGVTKTGKNYCGLAIASLLSSVVLVVGWLPGIICGHLARARIRRDPLLDGNGMAIAGLAISYLTLVAILLTATGFVLLNRHWSPAIVMRDTPVAQGDLERRIVDEVIVGDSSSEAEHGLQTRYGNTQRPTGTEGTNHWRGAQYRDVFAYVLKVLPDRAMTLNCRYSDNPNQRSFDVIVNDQVVGGEMFKFNVPGHFFDVEYKIPQNVTRGKDHVTVEFQSQEVMMLSKLFGCQMLKP